MSSPFLTMTQAAAQAGVSYFTLRRMLADGAGPQVTRIGGRDFISVSDMEAFIANSAKHEAKMQAPARKVMA